MDKELLDVIKVLETWADETDPEKQDQLKAEVMEMTKDWEPLVNYLK